jgi:hypothetical protein
MNLHEHLGLAGMEAGDAEDDDKEDDDAMDEEQSQADQVAIKTEKVGAGSQTAAVAGPAPFVKVEKVCAGLDADEVFF